MGDDLEMGSTAYPAVIVQVPMYNEKQVRSPSTSIPLQLFLLLFYFIYLASPS
jgi:hypothetical protein